MGEPREEKPRDEHQPDDKQHSSAGDEEQNKEQRRSPTERADELLGRAGQTVGMFASLAGYRVARIAAFAREEIEDMWADAQSLRSRPQETGEGTPRVNASEEARRKASELGVDLTQVKGSGINGEILAEDVEKQGGQ